MFKSRNRNARSNSSSAAAAGAPPSVSLPPVPPPAPPADLPKLAAPTLSPLQMTFDFELDPPGAAGSGLSFENFSKPSQDARPQTSDGSAPRKAHGGLSLMPPTLPPIPRVASRGESVRSAGVSDTSQSSSGGAGSQNLRGNLRAKDDSDNISTYSTVSSRRKSSGIRLLPQGSFEKVDREHPIDLMPKPSKLSATSLTPSYTGNIDEIRPSTSSGATPTTEASLFPSVRPKSSINQFYELSAEPASSRAFVDSRDKSYSQPPSRTSPSGQVPSRPPLVQTSQSLPLLGGANRTGATDSPASATLQIPSAQGVGRTSFGSSVYTDSPVASPRLQEFGPGLGSIYGQQSVRPSSSGSSLRAPKISGARLSPNSSVEDLRLLQRSPTGDASISRAPTTGSSMTAATGKQVPSIYSTSTAAHKPGTLASSSISRAQSGNSTSPLSHPGGSTIGTPYQATSQAFPLPQHVATRPKTAGAVSTVAGVSVPTHHTGSRLAPPPPASPQPSADNANVGPKKRKAEKGDKRKTRLLNPMSFLSSSRRKSAQDPSEVLVRKEIGREMDKSAAAQAYARQKSVIAGGGKVSGGMPADFDPRIVGTRVHDFSLPRRGTSGYGEAAFAEPERPGRMERSETMPVLSGGVGLGVAGLSVGGERGHSKQPSATSAHSSNSTNGGVKRKSPVFREMLSNDEDTEKRVSSAINAERLENKDFLQRASMHGGSIGGNTRFSQESSVLPPFARRSQILDPAQAAFAQELDENRRSDPASSGSASGGRSSSTGPPAQMRNSNYSSTSISEVSPVTQRSSGPPNIVQQVVYAGQRPDSLGLSLSPVSPRTPESRGWRPISAVSDMSGGSRPFSTASDLPQLPPPLPSPTLMEPRGRESAVEGSNIESQRSPYRNSAFAPELAVGVASSDSLPLGMSYGTTLSPPQSSSGGRFTIPDRTSSRPVAPQEMLDLPIPLPGSTSDISTPELTPEIGTANAVMFTDRLSKTESGQTAAGPRVVEKRASAVGHSRKTSAGLAKHRVSNASRFSFQFGESAAEEQALEEKARAVRASQGSFGGMVIAKQEEDDEDEFDEDAIDDMDELEVEQTLHEDTDEEPEATVAAEAPKPQSSQRTRLRQNRQQLQADSDEEEELADDVPDIDDPKRYRHLTWAEHPDLRSHSALAFHSRDASLVNSSNFLDYYAAEERGEKWTPEDAQKRQISSGSARTVDTNAALDADAITTPGEDAEKARSDFYMPPAAAGQSPQGSPQAARPPLPHRDSGNSERNRAASGLSFLQNMVGQHARDASASSGPGVHNRAFSASTNGNNRTSMAGTVSSATGLGVFNDLINGERRGSSPNGARPDSTNSKPGNPNRRTKDSETIPSGANWAELQQRASSGTLLSNGWNSEAFSSPDSRQLRQSAAYRGTIGKNIRDRNAASNQNLQYAASESGDESGDDMYFDDGGFEQDIRTGVSGRLDENVFDNDAYLRGKPLSGPVTNHQRDHSALTVASGISDGPYPSFAMGANPDKARARQSQMLLEDLPLITGPVDPKLMLQRNPSEDAKRLGLSKKVPPLPAPPESKEAMMQMQMNLQAYHAALADAANKAAAEGRFARQASTSTERSLRVADHLAPEDRSVDERSQYSREESGTANLAVPNDDGLSRTTSDTTTASKAEQSISYSPPKIDFDFGFDDTPLHEGGFEDFEADDDLVAAANQDVLGSDDAAFYGQEFGFYAKARPNSGDLEAINGGYFGEDGDDGLQRNRSLKEPNLTPITERTEMSARNSFVVGHGMFSPASGNAFGSPSPALGRLPTSPLMENEITSFEQLRKLRANAFGGSNASLSSDSSPASRTQSWQAQSPLSLKTMGASPEYSGQMGGYNSTESSLPNSAHPQQLLTPARHGFHESPQSASSNGQLPFGDNDVTPRKAQPAPEPQTAKKVNAAQTHSRKGSDSVTYVREADPTGGAPRWVLERRRTSEQGQLELVGREVVQGGWI